MMFCIPRNLAEKLKESALKGEVDIKKLYEMSSKERREFFEKHTNKELGKLLNTKFEEAMISKHKTAMLDWAKSVFKPEAQLKPVYKNIVDKINALDQMGVLDPKSEKAFLEDLVADKLGIQVTPEEVRLISEKAKKIDEAHKSLGKDLGNPLKEKENLDFFKAKKEMDDYLRELNPASKLKILTGTIGRGMMLFSVKSPILNIGSNLEVGFTEAFSRRLANQQFKGADAALAKDFVKMANKIYDQTGYDLSRMTSLKDAGPSGERVLGDTVHAQGPGKIRKAGRVVDDIVFKNLMGRPDAAFGAVHFADSVNLNSLKMAGGDTAKAKAYMQDAMKLEPETPQGEVLRAQGILDAQVATWTNETWASKVSLGVRKILNDVSGDIRIGDYLMPFVKTPANVIATGLDYAGLGIPKAAVKAFNGWKSGTLKDPHVVKGIARDLTRAGLGLVGGVIISTLLDDDDFVGAYDPARAQIEELRNSNSNSFRLGGKWISTDWLGPLSIPVTAIMYARKYGGTASEKAFQYAKGMGSAVAKLPGISDAADFIESQTNKKNQTLSDMTEEAQNYATEQAFSRLVPSFISDLAKAFDDKQRVSGKGFEGVKAKIPGVRNTMEVKKNIFGEELSDEPAWSNILFGGRVKTDQESPITKELSTISDDTGKSINFTNWDKTNSDTIAQFRARAGQEKFKEAQKEYGELLKKKIEETMADPAYQNMSTEAKVNTINSLDTKVMERIFKYYGFKYDKEGKTDQLKDVVPESKANKKVIYDALDEGESKILDPKERSALISSIKAEVKAGRMTVEEAKKLRNQYDRDQKNVKEAEGIINYITKNKITGEKLDSFLEKVQDADFMKKRGRDKLNKDQIAMIKDKILGPKEEKVKTVSNDEYVKNRGTVDLISDYAKAFATDPANAWKALTTKEELGVVKGNLVEMQRFYGLKFSDKGGSEEVKKRKMQELGIPLGEIQKYKLEHIVPVKAGGDTSDENLVPISNEEHDFYTPIDIAMAKAIQEGKVTRKEIEKLAIDFKIKKILTAEQVLAALKG